MGRTGSVKRVTKETDITITIDLDGTGQAEISTGIGFFDHMLNSFARHGLFDLRVEAKGDLEVDAHHTVEDVGIALGTAVSEALGEKRGIRRYGSCILPHDEALVLCAVDLSGRPFFVSDARFETPMVGEFPTEMVYDFFYAVSYSAMMNLHFREFSGTNAHHVIEAMFKSFAKALDAAVMIDERMNGELPTTKGAL